MKKTKKALLALAMSVVLTGASLPASLPVWAEDAPTIRYNNENYEVKTSGDYSYIVVDNEAVIVDYTNTQRAVTIPSELEGYTVTAIGHNDGSWNMTGAFEGNDSIQNLIIPDTVKTITEEAFMGCTGLQQVVVGKGLESIDKNAFAGCNYLQKIQFTGNTLKTINERAFYQCSLLDSVTIPESVETIGDLAFAECNMLSSITIPDTVTDLGAGTFFNCKLLKNAVIGEGVTTLKTAQLSWQDNFGCDNSKSGIFEGCEALETIALPDGLLSIELDAFAGSGLREIVIPDSVTTIGSAAFMACPFLQKANIGDSVITIDEKIFYNCPLLTEVKIGKRVDSIGDRAFWKCKSLKEITIPSNVVSIGAGAFYHCDSLEKAIIGNGVTSLSASSDSWQDNWGYDSSKTGFFEGCVSLKELTLGSSIVTIGSDAFAGTQLTEVTIPDSVVTMDSGIFMNCTSMEAVTIGDGVTKMEHSIFAQCPALENVEIGKGVNSIGSQTFYQCSSLKQIVLPSNVATIGEGSFYECTSLEEAVIGNGVTSLSSLSKSWMNNYGDNSNYIGMFEGCSSLKKVTLGNSLTLIGPDAFAGSAITELLLPSKLTKIEYAAFYNIPTLTKVYFTGSAPDIAEKGIFTPSNKNDISEGAPQCFYMDGQSGYDNFLYEVTKFTPNKVTFDLNSNDVLAITPSDQLIAPEGTRVIEPLELLAADYVFEGWYKEASCKTSWNFATDIATADTTLYAKWTPADKTIPSMPTTVLATKMTDKTISLTWDTVAGAKGYKVYVNGQLATPTVLSENSYVIENLEPQTSYEINVTAVNDTGESPLSLTIVAKTNAEPDSSDDPENPGGNNSGDNNSGGNNSSDNNSGDNNSGDNNVTSYVKGDVDSNGEVALADAQLALKAALKIINLEDTAALAADVTGNGDGITLGDAQLILKVALKITSF